MTETMVERVARAMRQAIADPKDGPLKPFETAPSRCQWLICARAAIEAMRSQAFVYRDNGHVVHEMRGAPDDIWKTLLTAALGDG